jgi:hypothetical protein
MDPATRRVPPDKRKRTEASCDKCKSRKQKCDKKPGQEQCRYCELRGIECSITQPRKKRVYATVEGDGNRLALLESLVKGLLPEADLSSNEEMLQLGKSLGIPLPNMESAYGDSEEAQSQENVEQETLLPLLPDQQGQVQYIGPASSFSFHLKLRRLMGDYSGFEFAMFGRNAADVEEDRNTMATVLPAAHSPGGRRLSIITNDCNSPSDTVREIEGPVLDALIDAYFDVVHSDFPVLHEASFRESYEIWCLSDANSAANPVWLCSLLCVLMLARRVVSMVIPEEAEHKWWRYVQKLLPTVFFASNVNAVQTLMLAALRLHNTSHRDACWNLTGTAVRIAFAIGLHRDDVKHTQSPLGRELRKQLWWTLYAFEQMQVSSYDRPSAIWDTPSLVGCPNERIVGAGHCPQDYMKWSRSLVVLLGMACRALNQRIQGATVTDEAYTRPLSPAAIVFRDLTKWKDELPSHLRLQSIDSTAPSTQRHLLLLHAQYHYTIVLTSRSSLLQRATLLTNNKDGTLSRGMLTFSETCIESGRALGRLLRKLDTIDKFNAFTWWDIFYTVASSLILTLDISCSAKQQRISSSTESQNILGDLARIMTKQLLHTRLPASMKKWATIVLDVSSMAEQIVLKSRSQDGEFTVSTQVIDSSLEALSFSFMPKAPQQNSFAVPSTTRDRPPASTQNSHTESAFSSNQFPYMHNSAHHFWSGLGMDDPNSEKNDWNWDDIDFMLRGGVSPNQSSSGRRI